MLEKEHKRAVIKPKKMATTMPKPTLPSEYRQLTMNSLVIKSLKSFANTSIGDGKRRGFPIIREAPSHTKNQNNEINIILVVFLTIKLSSIIEVISGDGITNACRCY